MPAPMELADAGTRSRADCGSAAGRSSHSARRAQTWPRQNAVPKALQRCGKPSDSRIPHTSKARLLLRRAFSFIIVSHNPTSRFGTVPLQLLLLVCAHRFALAMMHCRSNLEVANRDLKPDDYETCRNCHDKEGRSEDPDLAQPEGYSRRRFG